MGDERAVETEDGARSDTNLERKRQPADVDGTKELQEHVEYVVEPIPKDALGSGGDEDAFRGVLARFGVRATPDTPEEEEETGTVEEEDEQKKEIMGESEDSEEEGEENAKEPDRGLSHLPKKKRKEMQQSLVAKLKQISKHPEVVEVWDATAPDPSFLVEIKSIPNTVPVPQHWANKRRYLQGKRGQEKPPFELPDFIAATGIQKIRESYAVSGTPCDSRSGCVFRGRAADISWHRRRAASAGERGRQKDEAKAKGEDHRKSIKDRHRLPSLTRCILQAPNEAKADSFWRYLLRGEGVREQCQGCRWSRI